MEGFPPLKREFGWVPHERVARESGCIWSGCLSFITLCTCTSGTEHISYHLCNILWLHIWYCFGVLVDFSTRVTFLFRLNGGHLFECMRRVQLTLIESCNFDIQYAFAEQQSNLIGLVFWWTPRAVLVCEFLDVTSRFRLWQCNCSLLVDSIEIQFSLNRSILGLPADFPTRVPTPPLEEAEQA